MVCDECGARAANVHVTRIVNGQVTQQHLCSECAREKGEFHFMADPSVILQNLMAGLAGMAPEAHLATDVACPECGLPFSEFQKTGLLGCPHCYDAFQGLLSPIIDRIQAAPRHRGKVPSRAGADLKLHQEIQVLKEELSGLVSREDYEEAARVRDRIRTLESEAGGGGGA